MLFHVRFNLDLLEDSNDQSSKSRPGGHCGGSGGLELLAGGSVAGLDGHALVEGDVKSSEAAGVGFGRKIPVLNAAVESRLKDFDHTLPLVADDFPEIG